MANDNTFIAVQLAQLTARVDSIEASLNSFTNSINQMSASLCSRLDTNKTVLVDLVEGAQHDIKVVVDTLDGLIRISQAGEGELPEDEATDIVNQLNGFLNRS